MSNSTENQFILDCFREFQLHPKRCEPAVIKGAHKYIAQSIKGDIEGPKVAVLIEIFEGTHQGLRLHSYDEIDPPRASSYYPAEY